MGLKIVFMGTPLFASHMLEGLISTAHKVVAVVTVADKPAGRGQQLRESAVKETAKKAGIPIPIRITKLETFALTLSLVINRINVLKASNEVIQTKKSESPQLNHLFCITVPAAEKGERII